MHHRDHTDHFWVEVDKVMPDYREWKDWLRRRGRDGFVSYDEVNGIRVSSMLFESRRVVRVTLRVTLWHDRHAS